MKIAILSDIHQDTRKPGGNDDFFSMLNEQILEEKPRLVLMAGDFSNTVNGYRNFIRSTFMKIDQEINWDMTVVGILGNHDYYNHHIGPSHVSKAKPDFGETNGQYVLLEKDKVDIDGVTVYGTTLWSDMAEGTQIFDIVSMLNDFNYIHRGHKDYRELTAQGYIDEHRNCLAWLETKLCIADRNKSIVMTHHAPSFMSIHPKFAMSAINGGFASDLEWMINKYQPLLWVHGHTHEICDYEIGETRIINNPRGYRNETFVEMYGYKFIEMF